MHWCKTLCSSFALLCGAAATGFAPAERRADAPDPRDLVSLAKVDFATAVRTATAARAGHVVDVELEAGESPDAPKLVWEVDIVTADGLVEVAVDALLGGVVDEELEDEAEELASYRRVLRHAEKTLVELVAGAAEVVRGPVVAAGLAIEDGQPVAELTVANGRYLLEVTVEARAGHLVHLALVDDLHEGDAEDDHDAAEEEDEEDEGDEDEGDREADDEEEEEEEEAEMREPRGGRGGDQPREHAREGAR